MDANTTGLSRRGLLSAAGLATIAAVATREGALGGQPSPWHDGPIPVAAHAGKRMTAAARAFLASLTDVQRTKAHFADLGNAARTQWSNFPAGFAPRPGVALGDMTDAQRMALHGLLRASTSSQGYCKMTGAIRADDLLHDLQGGNVLFGAANYYASVYGNPADTNWAWMLTGHHMTAAFTISGDDRTAFTPMFTGAQPQQVPSGVLAGTQVLPHDTTCAYELLASLGSAQRAVAVLGTSAPGDVFAGPGRADSLKSYAGISSAKLSAAQQRLLWRVVVEFVANADADAAAAQLALVREGWPRTHFAWQGPPPSADARYYFRVHGPRILIEYDVQEALTSQGGHVHAIVRDPSNDYGVDWLGLHYREASHFGGPGGGLPPGGGAPPGGPSEFGPGGRGPGPGPGGPGAGGPSPMPSFSASASPSLLE